jgi:hypothetical protein
MNEENVTIVFHGFLNLTNLEKLKLTEEINHYLDSMNREPIRAEAEEKFKQIEFNKNGKVCKCCGR